MQRKGIASALLCLLLFSILFLTRHTYASPPNCHCQDHDRVLRLESPPLTGQDVEELQTILRKLGYYDDAIDGVYNERTEKAVMDWQVWAGLPANGIFGSQEQEALTISIAHESIKTPSPAPPSGEMRIEIDVEKKTLTLLVEDQIFQVYPCAVGKSKTKTPIGEWRIIQKGTNWGGGFGTRWLGLNVPWGIYGIHGTNNPSSIGTEASAGCIRMHNKDVEQIYPWITVGTRVSILGPFLVSASTIHSNQAKAANRYRCYN